MQGILKDLLAIEKNSMVARLCANFSVCGIKIRNREKGTPYMTKEEREILDMIRNCKDPERALNTLLEITLRCLSAEQSRESCCGSTDADRPKAV